jgi:hypothetical protein
LLLEAKALATEHRFLPPGSPFARSGRLMFLAALAASRNDFSESYRLVNEAAHANPADPAPMIMLQRMKQAASGRQ